MTTYVALNLVFMVLLAGLYAYGCRYIHGRALLLCLAGVLALTALFDPIMIAVGLVAYDADKLAGIYWLGAPIEDFAYAVFAVPFVALVWSMLERRDA